MILVRVHTRRFSSAAAAVAQTTTPTSAPAANDAISRLTKWFQPQPIDELVEMKTLRNVQNLTEQVAGSNAVATQLTAADSAANFRVWLQQYQSQKNFPSGAAIDKEAFEALMKDASAHIQATETALLDDKPKISSDDVQDQDAYVDALKLKLARHKCNLVSAHFQHLDTDQDGLISPDAVETFLATMIEGSGDDWMRYQFQVADSDCDECVTETESKQILDAMIQTQRVVLAELFEFHVANLPKKKPMKMVNAAMDEANWKEKIPEKARSIFHYAQKEEQEEEEKKKKKPLLVHWETFRESQQAEMPELHDLLRVYAKGVYDERYTFYELKQEKRGRRIKGVLLAIALGVGDFVFAII